MYWMYMDIISYHAYFCSTVLFLSRTRRFTCIYIYIPHCYHSCPFGTDGLKWMLYYIPQWRNSWSVEQSKSLSNRVLNIWVWCQTSLGERSPTHVWLLYMKPSWKWDILFNKKLLQFVGTLPSIWYTLLLCFSPCSTPFRDSMAIYSLHTVLSSKDGKKAKRGIILHNLQLAWWLPQRRCWRCMISAFPDAQLLGFQINSAASWLAMFLVPLT